MRTRNRRKRTAVLFILALLFLTLITVAGHLFSEAATAADFSRKIWLRILPVFSELTGWAGICSCVRWRACP